MAKLDPTGSRLLYSTYLGGTAPDAAFAVAVDGSGAAYVTGGTSSPDFPATPGALQPAYSGVTNSESFPTLAGNGFVTKFDASGNVVYSTFIGAQGSQGTAITVDAQGDAAVNVQAQYFDSAAAVCTGQPAVSVLNAAGSAIAAFASVNGDYLAMDRNGGLYSAATTRTLAFLSTPGAFQTSYGGGDTDVSAAKVDFSQPAAPELTAVVNAASFFGGYSSPATGAVAPGEIITLFGNAFGSEPTVYFDQFRAPMLYYSNCQINAVVPFELAPGTPSSAVPFSTSSTVVTVLSGSRTTGSLQLPVVAGVPGIFTLNGTGTGQAAVINQNGTLNGAANPAPRQSVISVYMTGTGLLNPQIADGSPGPSSPPFPMPVQYIAAQIGGVSAKVLFAGQAPTLVAGTTQVNVQIPRNAPNGSAVVLTIDAGGYSTGLLPQSQVFVAIE